jgi:arylsulfatase A-like enzyme
VNVIVICSDTFRRDHLGFHHEQPVFTPHLDRLARESAVFSNFWLCSFPTVVNRIEVFTGRYTFPLHGWGNLPSSYPVLAELFRHHGFTTALVTDNPHLFYEDRGFERGFDVVKGIPGQSHYAYQSIAAPMIELPCPARKIGLHRHNLERYRRNAYWHRQHNSNTALTLFHEATAWLKQPPRNFFLWLDAFDPHEPWDAREEFRQQYSWNQQGDRVPLPKQGYADQYSSADLENMRSLYKAEVTQIDTCIGDFLDTLHRYGLWDNTAVIFCSDHGYYFGEHGLLGKLCSRQTGKPNTLYEEVAHIPLFVRHPDGRGRGQTIAGLCQPPDLFPTALELAGLPPVPWAQGYSLVSRLEGDGDRQSFAVGGSHPHKKAGASCLTVVTDEWCLIYSPVEGLAGSELFHRPSDPKLSHNVIEAHRPVAQQLFQQLVSWLDSLGVPSTRQKQLLENAPLGTATRLQDTFRQWQNHWRHRYKKVRHAGNGNGRSGNRGPV